VTQNMAPRTDSDHSSSNSNSNFGGGGAASSNVSSNLTSISGKQCCLYTLSDCWPRPVRRLI